MKQFNRIDESIGSRLREKRISTGWSQRKLAKRLAVDPKAISAYERGAKRISADRLLRLSKLFGVQPSYFFGLSDEPRTGAGDTLPEQGFRLHRAFVGVKSAAVREAIVTLVVELSKVNNPA